MARRIRSLMFGSKKGKDGVVYHREHRSKRGRNGNKMGMRKYKGRNKKGCGDWKRWRNQFNGY